MPFEKIKKLLTDAYNLLQNALRRNEDTLQFRNIIDDIEDLVQAAKSQCKNVKTEENYLV